MQQTALRDDGSSADRETPRLRFCAPEEGWLRAGRSFGWAVLSRDDGFLESLLSVSFRQTCSGAQILEGIEPVPGGQELSRFSVECVKELPGPVVGRIDPWCWIRVRLATGRDLTGPGYDVLLLLVEEMGSTRIAFLDLDERPANVPDSGTIE